MTKHTPNLIQPQLPFDDVHYIVLAKNAIDVTGQKFNRLTVLGPVARAKGRQIIWLCQCDCGKHIEVPVTHLRSGHTSSCGCLRIDTTIARNVIHGLSHHPLYGTWLGMMRRCNKPDSTNSKYYKERGISVCNEWSKHPQPFFDYVSQLPHCGEKGYSLDRINNNLGYCPDNVRWATAIEQVHNRRVSRMITFDGKTKNLAEWARIIGITKQALNYRIERGWPLEKALTQKAGHKR